MAPGIMGVTILNKITLKRFEDMLKLTYDAKNQKEQSPLLPSMKTTRTSVFGKGLKPVLENVIKKNKPKFGSAHKAEKQFVAMPAKQFHIFNNRVSNGTLILRCFVSFKSGLNSMIRKFLIYVS
jgi:hypothetical protein